MTKNRVGLDTVQFKSTRVLDRKYNRSVEVVRSVEYKGTPQTYKSARDLARVVSNA